MTDPLSAKHLAEQLRDALFRGEGPAPEQAGTELRRALGQAAPDHPELLVLAQQAERGQLDAADLRTALEDYLRPEALAQRASRKALIFARRRQRRLLLVIALVAGLTGLIVAILTLP